MTPHAHVQVLRYLARELERYSDDPGMPVETTPSYLRDFARRAIECSQEIPLDKLGRWTGYIQGVMAARGWLDVQAERDRTRPIFTSQS